MSPFGLSAPARWTVLSRIGAVAAIALVVVAAEHAAQAATITGTVRNEASAGIGNVDIDCIDLCTGNNIFLTGDKTAADGTFNVVVPGGTYDVHFTPPAGSTVAAGDLHDLVVGTDVALGIVTLHPGRLVSGTVFTSALGPAAGVDLKFVDRSTAERVYLSKDVTNASGQYAIRVPPGAYDLDFRPPAAATWGDRERFDLVVGIADIGGLRDTLPAGVVVTGSVRDSHGNKIKNVDVDVFDTCTGDRVPTSHDNTDVNGNWSIVIPAGTYTFNFDPPRCKALESTRETGITISSNKNIGTETMRDAVSLQGAVHDDAGLPLPQAKLKFFDIGVTGSPRQAVASDRTDAAGTYSILVPPGTYDIDIEPPSGRNDRVGHLGGVLVSGPTSLGTTTLLAGVPLSGHVVGPGGAPVLDVDIDVVDTETRVSQRIAHDNTDALGNFTVVVAPGTYDIHYDPPGCLGFAPMSQDSRLIAAPTTLPALQMVVGAHVLGTVVDGAGLPAANVDLDFYSAGSTAKTYTPNDQTAGDGTYDVVVPPGTYDIKYVPSALTRLRPALLPGVDLSATRALGTLTLVDGWLVSGVVRDTATGTPIAGVVVDFYPPGGSVPILTTHHTSAAAGDFSVSVPAGAWDVRFTPPAGSPFAPKWRRGVSVAADLSIGDEMLAAAVLGVGPRPARGLSLSSPWPNPAHHDVAASVVAPGPGGGELSAWDVTGRRVATVWRGVTATPLVVRWNASRDDGSRLPAGVYYLRLAAPAGTVASRRVLWTP